MAGQEIIIIIIYLIIIIIRIEKHRIQIQRRTCCIEALENGRYSSGSLRQQGCTE
jgi:hypothetical protein